MPGFDRTGTWEERPMGVRGKRNRTELIESEKLDYPKDPEIGYRPLIYGLPSRSLDWRRWFGWMWRSGEGRER